ncbi:MAG: SDR family oxidoreductase [Pseudomonadota bacterium]
MDELAGKTALVTGAAGGIGAAIVAALRAEDVRVAGADLGPSGSDHDLIADLSESAAADALPEQAARALGRLDIVVNNAGVIPRGIVTETTDDDYARTMSINVEAPFRICRAAIPILARGGGGAIVNVSSCWGVHPGPGHPLYVMSKAALASLTQCLGIDHAHQNIRVNAVCPNEVNTPMIRSGFTARGFDPETAIADLHRSVPLGRIAEPEDIADLVVFLASDRARYLCGALIEANGGKAVG